MGRRHPGLTRTAVIFLLILLTASAAFIKLERTVSPVLFAIAEKKTQILATEALNNAVRTAVVESVNYDDLIHREYGPEGRLVFMQPNWVQINDARTRMISLSQEELKQMEAQPFGIPLGQAFGSQIFATYGPVIQVAIVPSGPVRVEVREVFDDAGVNQTRHVIYLDVVASMEIVIPLLERTIEVHNETAIAESIIVGEVPETYINFRLGP